MSETPASLLFRLRQSSSPELWERFVELYAPLIRHWARRAGMQESDVADLLQDVFSVLLRRLPQFEYDPARSFRAWLRQIVLNVWRAHVRRRRGAALENSPEPAVEDPAEEFWNDEFAGHVTRRALLIMKRDFAPTTWQACWAVVVEQRPAADVARELGITVGAVYAARFRVLGRLREELDGTID
jgi:RNA polymerase sigma-70 factor (ECF subfamily)